MAQSGDKGKLENKCLSWSRYLLLNPCRLESYRKINPLLPNLPFFFKKEAAEILPYFIIFIPNSIFKTLFANRTILQNKS